MLCIVLAAVGAWSGCGSGDSLGRSAVSGRITFDGEPVEHGSIQFSPHGGQGAVGSGALIADGKYAIPAAKGLPPGKYLVRIFSVERSAVDRPAEPPGPVVPPPAKQQIPAQYNVQSQLIVEVTADGTNRFDFDMQTK